MNIQSMLQKFNTKKTAWIVKILVTVFFVYLVNKSLDYKKIQTLAFHPSLLLIFQGISLGLAGLLVQIVRWKYILKKRGSAISWNTATATLLYGYLMAFVTPGKVGELFRGASLLNTTKTNSVMAVVFEKICAGAVTIFAGICAALLHGKLYGYYKGETIIIVASLVLVMILLVSYSIAVVVKNKPFFKTKKWFSHVSLLWRTTKPLTVVNTVVLSAIAHALLIIQTAILFKAFYQTDIVFAILCACEAYAFMLLLPFFIANIGIREYSFVLFLGASAASHAGSQNVTAAAIVSSLCILVINILFPAFTGLCVWILSRLRFKFLLK